MTLTPIYSIHDMVVVECAESDSDSAAPGQEGGRHQIGQGAHAGLCPWRAGHELLARAHIAPHTIILRISTCQYGASFTSLLFRYTR